MSSISGTLSTKNFCVYEKTNANHFLLLSFSIVEAKEANSGKLSSTATVTVEVLDLNDNSPQFPKNSYTAIVSEAASEGQEIISIVAEDRDSGDFGSQGIRYKLSGRVQTVVELHEYQGNLSIMPSNLPLLDDFPFDSSFIWSNLSSFFNSLSPLTLFDKSSLIFVDSLLLSLV